MKVKVTNVAMQGDFVNIQVELGKGQNRQLYNYQYTKKTDLDIEKIKADIRKDVERKEALEARVNELKNLVGKELDLEARGSVAGQR